MTTFAGVPEAHLEYFLGTDQAYAFRVFTDLTKEVIREVTGYTTSFMVKRRLSDADADALLTASGSVSGTFNSDPDENEQVITATLVDTDTDTEISPGLAYFELKRTDAGAEQVLVFGTIALRRGVHGS